MTVKLTKKTMGKPEEILVKKKRQRAPKIVKYRIRTRVMAAFSVMLFLIFSIIGISFNIVVWRFIHGNAAAELDRSINTVQESMRITGAVLQEIPVELLNFRPPSIMFRRNDFRIESNMVVVDAFYQPLGGQIFSDRSLEIIEAINVRGIDLDGARNRMISTDSGTYFFSSLHIPFFATDEGAYWVFYADITGLTNFASRINMFLIILVCVMFIATAAAAFFLSKSFTGPIQKLSTLALNIGRGDFTPRDYMFVDREFDDLNTVLNKSARQLAVYDIEQKSFFQNVSHELRTPLMTIQCYAEGISCGLMEPENASSTILTETARLNEMVKDLLYISKIDNITSAYEVTSVDLLRTIQECAERQQAVADRKNIQFIFKFSEPAVYYDCVGELISRAVENLISNAIRYAVSKITLTCKKDTEKTEIIVMDDGAGIKEEIMPHIFERFYKGEDGNYGIGLSIVKSIIEQHGGTVNAENISEGGAAFTVSLPAAGDSKK